MTNVLMDDADGTVVTVDARVLRATASDFILDFPQRHSNQHRLRRALVHNQQDGLTINFNNDYPGGVTINDVVSLNNRHKFGMSLSGVSEISAVRLASAVEGGTGSSGAPSYTLAIRGHIMFEPAPGSANSEVVSLQSLLSTLQNQVGTLTRRLSLLEGAAGTGNAVKAPTPGLDTPNQRMGTSDQKYAVQPDANPQEGNA